MRCVVATLLACAISAHAQSGGTWQTLAPMPSARQEISTAVLDGKIYVIAGYDVNGASTTTVEVYNPNTDTWSSAEPIPIANNHNNAAVAAGKLYTFGGLSNRTFVYDPATDSWADVAPMNFTHGGTAAVGVLNNKIYVAGGTGGTERELEVYDPTENSWTVLAPMSVGRNHTGGAFIGGKFYVVGGRGSAAAPTALERYDPQMNTWTTRAPMPTGRSGIGVAAVNGELFVFGGEIPQLHAEVEAYSPLTNTWRTLPNMPNPRHGLWASVIGTAVYLPGGGSQQGFGATNLNEVFVPTPLALPRIEAVMLQEGVFQISFSTVADASYTLQGNVGFHPDNWSNISSAPGTGVTLTLQDSAPGVAPKFYRVLAQRP